MFLSHGALGLAGAYATKNIWDRKEFREKERALLYTGAIISGILPDFDLAFYALGVAGPNHHAYITHVPFLYLLIATFILLFTNLFKKEYKKFIQSFVIVFITNITIHFIADAFAGHIKLLYPFSDRVFSFFRLNPLIISKNPILNYFFTPWFAFLEVSSIVLGFYILFSKLAKERLTFIYSFITLSVTSIIAIAMTLIFIFF